MSGVRICKIDLRLKSLRGRIEASFTTSQRSPRGRTKAMKSLKALCKKERRESTFGSRYLRWEEGSWRVRRKPSDAAGVPSEKETARIPQREKKDAIYSDTGSSRVDAVQRRFLSRSRKSPNKSQDL